LNLSVLKAGFRKCHRRPQQRLPLGCELRALCSCVKQRQANTNPPHLHRIPTKCRDNGNCTVCSWLKLATNDPASCKTRFTRGRVRELKNGHNSVTVQNRTHVSMNFFHHKDLGNHLLQLCPKVVKHPVYTLHVSDRFTVHHQEYLNIVDTAKGVCHAGYVDCLLADLLK